MVIDLQLFGFAAPMYLKPLFITGLSIAAAMTANSSVASPFVSSGLAISAFETARTVRESADERMTQAVTDTSRADGGSIWLDLKAAGDEADTMVKYFSIRSAQLRWFESGAFGRVDLYVG